MAIQQDLAGLLTGISSTQQAVQPAPVAGSKNFAGMFGAQQAAKLSGGIQSMTGQTSNQEKLRLALGSLDINKTADLKKLIQVMQATGDIKTATALAAKLQEKTLAATQREGLIKQAKDLGLDQTAEVLIAGGDMEAGTKQVLEQEERNVVAKQGRQGKMAVAKAKNAGQAVYDEIKRGKYDKMSDTLFLETMKGEKADLKTFAAIGCYGMSVITALTAQNTQGVTAIHALPPSFAIEQMTAVFTDIGADAVKIGMLYSAELIEAVSETLNKYRARNIVLDPVMVAQSGDKLLQDDAIQAIKDHLMPVADVVTPNLPEAEVLLGQKIESFEDMQHAARSLAQFGGRSILIKGGHLEESTSTDLLYLTEEDRFVILEAERVDSRNNHGTGCTLSSAIAAYISRGSQIEDAVRKAKTYIQNAIRAGAAYKIGHGHGPVHHFFEFWE